jgi:hypothetical protein
MKRSKGNTNLQAARRRVTYGQLTSTPLSVPRNLSAWSYISPIAPHLRTVMKYAENFTATTGITQDYQFRTNSLFDPDLTFSGHQPLGFDQMATLYNKYRVYSCTYKVRIQMKDTTYTAATVCVVPTNDTTGLANPISTAIEHTGSNYSLTNFGGPPVLLEGLVNNWILNGRTRQQYGDDDTTASLMSTNPSENLILHICMACTDDASTLNLAGVVELVYDVEFFDPLQLTRS